MWGKADGRAAQTCVQIFSSATYKSESEKKTYFKKYIYYLAQNQIKFSRMQEILRSVWQKLHICDIVTAFHSIFRSLIFSSFYLQVGQNCVEGSKIMGQCRNT